MKKLLLSSLLYHAQFFLCLSEASTDTHFSVAVIKVLLVNISFSLIQGSVIWTTHFFINFFLAENLFSLLVGTTFLPVVITLHGSHQILKKEGEVKEKNRGGSHLHACCWHFLIKFKLKQQSAALFLLTSLLISAGLPPLS